MLTNDSFPFQHESANIPGQLVTAANTHGHARLTGHPPQRPLPQQPKEHDLDPTQPPTAELAPQPAAAAAAARRSQLQPAQSNPRPAATPSSPAAAPANAAPAPAPARQPKAFDGTRRPTASRTHQ